MTVSIEFADGSIHTVSENKYYAEGEVVVDECYKKFDSVKISGPNGDGWRGTFEFSMSGESRDTPVSIWTEI